MADTIENATGEAQFVDYVCEPPAGSTVMGGSIPGAAHLVKAIVPVLSSDSATVLVIVAFAAAILVNIVLAWALVSAKRQQSTRGKGDVAKAVEEKVAAPAATTVQYIFPTPAHPVPVQGQAVDAEMEASALAATKVAMARESHASASGTCATSTRRPTELITVDEAVANVEGRNKVVAGTSPSALLEELKAGNARFWNNAAEKPEMTPMQRRVMTRGQLPKVAILGCADSRVPLEMIFDQGIGDVFVCRNAGNLYCDKVAGTIDYAVHHLNVRLVIIMGHQGCGAVKAARLPTKAILQESPKLKDMLLDMKRDLDYCSETLDKIADPNARDREAVLANAQAQVKKLLQDPLISTKVDAGELLVVPAFYEIASGVVDFVDPPAPKEDK